MSADKRCSCPRLTIGEVCTTGGYFHGQHEYTIHVTRATFECACGAVMGRFRSSAPNDGDPFGECPVVSDLQRRYDQA